MNNYQVQALVLVHSWRARSPNQLDPKLKLNETKVQLYVYIQILSIIINFVRCADEL